ncbi:MAG: radical SAM family heme chaperone HemW [Pirellulales bacterium]|nr:radical SAM family heme chaperone HemW [Pirellulales bacterium]
MTHPLTATPEPRAAYVHVPFCVHRCGYCNFTVVAARDDLIEPYLDALQIELQALEQPRTVATLFLGGGTPTRLPPEPLERLLRLVTQWFVLAPGGEFSVEANPGDLDRPRADVLAAAGVNRVSLGVQSFRIEKLQTLERDHTAADIGRSVELARGFARSVAIDLIFAAPGESLNDWQHDLAEAVTLPVDHVSTYGLTYEKGTRFWSRREHGALVERDEETQRSMYLAAIDRLADAGFEHYEISNFARPGHRCRHNEVYWAGASYWAAGPGAARYVAGRREVNHRSTTNWIKRLRAGESPVAERETLGSEDRAREALVLGLRRVEGIERASFAAQWGFEIDELLGPELPRLRHLALLADDGRRIALTRAGLVVSDAIWPRVLRR